MHLVEDSLPSIHMATTMYIKYIREPRSISFTWPQPYCCHTYRPQPIEHVRKPCYGSHTVMPGGVPKYEHSLQRPRTTKLVNDSLRRAFHLDPSVLATTSTLANPSHNSRFLVFFRYPEPLLKESHSEPQPIECHVLNPYPEPQLEDTFRATTHGTLASPPRRYFKSHVEHLSQVSSHLINIAGTSSLNVPLHPYLL